ncbi:MAG: sigma-70 family RNA polymerase sigma factor [Myxococcota bacterium]
MEARLERLAKRSARGRQGLRGDQDAGARGPEGSRGGEGCEGGETDEDIELMLALGRGDDAAFDVLFSRWGGRLVGYLQRMVSDLATAEELAQEAFLRVYRAREGYAAASRFSTWLYRIATNLALNELRRPARRRPHASTDDEEAPLTLVSPGPGPESSAEARLAVGDLSTELERLPERQRMALWLSAVEGQSYAEVAEALGTTDKSVKSLVHRARSTLAARLTPGEGR